MKIIGSMRTLDGTRGAVRVEDVFDTDIDDLWEACTKPERLARWIAEVSGDLRVGGEFQARFTSAWEGTGRVEACEPPRRLLVVTRQTGESDEQVIEATLSSAGDKTILVVEERGIPTEYLADYGAGWQVQVEDLAAFLAGRGLCDMKARWDELIPAYRQMASPDVRHAAAQRHHGERAGRDRAGKVLRRDHRWVAQGNPHWAGRPRSDSGRRTGDAAQHQLIPAVRYPSRVVRVAR